MKSLGMIGLAGLGLAVSACSYSNTTTTAPAAATVYPVGSQQACIDYGFRPGTDGYNTCVARESEARALGRAPRDYAVARVSNDADVACRSYGLIPGTMGFDRCMSREIDARRPAQQAVVVSTPAGGYGTPTTYVTTTYAAPPAAPPAVDPPTGVQAFRDEYGFRYDGQGNRIDRNGTIISPQSPVP